MPRFFLVRHVDNMSYKAIVGKRYVDIIDDLCGYNESNFA